MHLNEPIAVVGLSCRFPGGVRGPKSFWEMMLSGVDGISEIPSDRWDKNTFYHPQDKQGAKTDSKWGGFVDDTDKFDPYFFGISPKEAGYLDPQQRLLLEASYEAFEDAGLTLEQMSGSNTGVYVGVMNEDFSRLQYAYPEGMTSYTNTGSSRTLTANRLSYVFNLQGPSMAVDTACSSSLVCSHLGTVALQNGECDMALIAGVNFNINPEIFISISKLNMLSPDGRCKAFDESGNGYVRSEGVGVVMLKRLDDAMRDNDRIYSVIRGSVVNSDGQSSIPITAPSSITQEQMLRNAYRRSGVDPKDIEYVEAHGTGTFRGDPVELSALGRVLSENRKSDEYFRVGSVKTNIGHLESASGIAGFIKALLCLKYEGIPRNLHFKTPNPNIPFDDLKIKVVDEYSPWPSNKDKQRKAAVNSFGFGGTNAHIILEDPPHHFPSNLCIETSSSKASELNSRFHILPISGHSYHVIPDRAQNYHNFIREEILNDKNVSFEDFHYTAAIKRSHFSNRCALVFQDEHNLLDLLSDCIQGEKERGILFSNNTQQAPKGMVFVFSGQGPQWWGMGRELLERHEFFRACFNEINEILQSLCQFSLLSELLKNENESQINETYIAQPAIFAIQVSLAKCYMHLGITPTAVVGHSVGEVAAAYISGCLSLDEAVQVIYHRSRLQQQVTGGSMLAVELNENEAQEIIAPYNGRVSIGAINSPSSITLSGDTEPLEEIAKQLTYQETFNRFLRVKCAFHSIHMQPIEDEMLSSLHHIRPTRPHIPVYASVYGRQWEEGDFNAQYWWLNVRQSVLFSKSIERIVEEQEMFSFLEIASHPVLSSSISKTVTQTTSQSALLFPSLKRKEDQEFLFMESIARLFVNGINVNWNLLAPKGNVISLPLYPWQYESYWKEGKLSQNWRMGKSPNTGYIDSNLPFLSFASAKHEIGEEHVWDLDISLDRFPFLSDHVVQGNIVVPAAFLLDFVFECGTELFNQWFSINAVILHTPLFISEQSPSSIRLSISAKETEPLFQISSLDSDTLFVNGNLSPKIEKSSNNIDFESIQHLQESSQQVDQEEYYASFASRGLLYGPKFRGIHKIWKGDTNALVELANCQELDLDSSFKWHPALFDATLQGLGGISSLGNIEGVGLPVGFDKLVMYSKQMSSLKYCHVTISRKEGQKVFGDLLAIDSSANVLAEIKGFCVQFLQSVSSESKLKDMFYSLSWEQSPLASSDPSGNSTEESFIIFGLRNNSNTSHLIQGLKRSQSKDIITVYPSVTNSIRQIDHYEFELNPFNRDHFEEFFNQIKIYDRLNILYCWSQTTQCNVDDEDDEMDFLSNIEDYISVPIVHICQAFVTKEKLSLWLISQGCQQISSDDSNDTLNGFAQSSMWGIGRTLMLEFLEWKVYLCDIPETFNSSSQQLLVDNILSPDQETEIAIRGSERWVNRIKHQKMPQIPRSYKTITRSESPHLDYTLSVEPGSLKSFCFVEYNRVSELDSNQIEIESDMSALNFKDIMYALNLLPEQAVSFKDYTLGSECVGRISRTGPEVTSVRVGDRVLGQCSGGFSSVTYSLEDYVVRIPESLSSEEAITIPTAFITARYGLQNLAQIQPGETVLIHSAAGAVGLAAVQHCKNIGAHVIATSGTEEKREYLRRKMNIEHVFNSRNNSFISEILRVTNEEGVDVILNSLAGDLQKQSISLLKRFGRFIEIGKKDIYESKSINLWDFSRSISFYSLDLIQLAQYRPKVYKNMLEDIANEISQGTLNSLPTTKYSMSKLKDAFYYMMSGNHIGKIIIDNRDLQVPITVNVSLFAENTTYMISGGLSGFGFDVAKWMLQNNARNLVLLGRRGSDKPGVSEKLEMMRNEYPQANIIPVKCDITQFQDVQRVVSELEEKKLPPLKGIIQSAMILDDGLIVDQTQSRIQKVLNPKVFGSWNLHLATNNIELDFFILFSSVVSVIGNQGQVSYAAGNSFMDGLAQYRRKLGLPATSINWGALEDSGYVSRNDSVAKQLSSRGVKGLKLKDTLQVLEIILRKEDQAFDCQVPVMDTDWDEFAEFFPLLHQIPRFSPLLSEQETSDNNTKGIKHEMLNAVDQHQRKRLLMDYLKEQLASILEISPSKINEQKSLANLGVDSLAAVELRNILQKELSIIVSVVTFLQKDSFLTIVDQLVAKFDDNQQNKPKSDIQTAKDSQNDDHKLETKEPKEYSDSTIHSEPIDNDWSEESTEHLSKDDQDQSSSQPVLEIDTDRNISFGSDTGIPQITPDSENKFKPFPLNDIQQAYWAGRGRSIELGNSSTHFYAEIVSDFEIERLQEALNKIISQHDMLRCIVNSDGTQQIQKEVPRYSAMVNDLRNQSENSVADKFKSIREKLSHNAFELDNWPLFEFQITRTSDTETVLHVSVDLIIVDGRSLSMVMQDIMEFYAHPHKQPTPLELSFRDYVLAFQQYENLQMFQESKSYWMSKLDQIHPPPSLPLVQKPDSIKRPIFKRVARIIDDATFEQFERIARYRNTTPSLILCALYAHTISLWSSQTQFTLNLTIFNRLPVHPDVNYLLGDFTSTVLLSIDYDPSLTFKEMTQKICDQMLQDIEHSLYSGVRVIRKLAEKKGKLLNMPVVFTGALYKDSPEDFAHSYAITQTPQVWIDNQCLKLGGKLKISWDHVADLFPEGMIDDMLDCYVSLIERFARNDSHLWDSKINSLDLLPARQIDIIEEANETDDKTITPELMHSSFIRQVHQEPQHPALITFNETMSYEELHRYAAVIASQLTDLNVKQNELVTIVMEKGWENIVAALGIMYSGAAYLPIDYKSTPHDRIFNIIYQGESRIILTTSDISQHIDFSGLDVLNIDQISPQKNETLKWSDPRIQSIQDLAYVVFTSGSTGQPKGVSISHASAVNTLKSINKLLDIKKQDRTFMLSSLAFDLSVYDIFGALSAGATIIIPPADAAKDPSVWLKLLNQYQITIWNSVPALFEMFTEYLSARKNLPIEHSIRKCILSGDWIPLDLPRKVQNVFGSQISLYSCGGATEGSIWSIIYPIKDVQDSWRSIPYGKPLPNQRFYVLDEFLRLCPLLKPGELYIGGTGLAQGYWNDNEKTKNSFITHPKSGERLYRTGDLGRILPDGNIEFMGRADTQVKIQGFRVELGEIEHNLSSLDKIDSSVVMPYDNHTKLAAFVIRSNKQYSSQTLSSTSLLSYKLSQPGIRKDIQGMERNLIEKRSKKQLQHEISMRQTFRNFLPESLPLDNFDRLLSKLTSVAIKESPLPKYQYPSAGSLYGVQAYVLIKYGRVEDQDAGAYYLNPDSKSLVKIANGIETERFYSISLQAEPNMEAYLQSAFSIILVGDIDVVNKVYGEKARDFCLLEAGYMGQLLMDKSADFDIGLCPIGTFTQHDPLRQLLKLNGNHEILHSFVGGYVDYDSNHFHLDKKKPVKKTVKHPDIFETETKKSLSGILPEYMVPESIIEVEEFPLTSTGKIDRKGLLKHSAFTSSSLSAHDVNSKSKKKKQKTSKYLKNQSKIKHLVKKRKHSQNKTKIQNKKTKKPKKKTRTEKHQSIEIKEILIDIWKEVLSINSFDPSQDSFFALGGDSVKGMRVIALANRNNINLTPRLLYEHPFIDQLVSLIMSQDSDSENDNSSDSSSDSDSNSDSDSSLSSSSSEDSSDNDDDDDDHYSSNNDDDDDDDNYSDNKNNNNNQIDDAEPEIKNGSNSNEFSSSQKEFPLTSSQRGILFHSLNPIESSLYTQQFGCYLSDKLQDDTLKQAWQILYNHFSSFRLKFSWQGQRTPSQIISQQRFPWTTVHVNSSQIHSYCEQQVREQFDFENGPLIKFSLLKLENGQKYFLSTYHHIILDGWSMSLLLGYAVQLALEIQTTNRDYTLPEDVFPKFAQKFISYSPSNSTSFWKEYLAGYAQVHQLDDFKSFSKTPIGKGKYQEQSIEIQAKLMHEIQSFCNQNRITFASFLATVWSLVVKAYSHSENDDIVFGMTFSGRGQKADELSDKIGMFINNLPLRIQAKDTISLIELVKHVQNSLLNVSEYEYTPLQEIQKVSEIERSQSLFQTLLVIENFPIPEEASSYIHSPENLRCPARTNFPVNLLCNLSNNRISFDLSYCIQYLSSDKASQILDNMTQIMMDIVGNSTQSVNSIMPKRLIEKKPPHNNTVFTMIENQSHISSNAIAVKDNTSSLTYSSLLNNATQTAISLKQRDIEPGDRIGVIESRRVNLIGSILGIWLSGGIYVPLDPTIPEKRLQNIINEADLKLIISDSFSVGIALKLAPPQVSMLLMEDVKFTDSSSSNYINFPPVNAMKAAYIMFTSGSTGRPKGVTVPHSALTNVLESVTHGETKLVKERDTMAAVTSESFDISLLELLAPLIVGGTVHIVDRNVAGNGQKLSQELLNSGATVMQATPSTWDLLLQSTHSQIPSLCVLCGGERLSGGLASQLLNIADPDRGVWNLYGPTETTVWSMIHQVNDQDCSLSSVPIGHPIQNTQISILTNNGLDYQPGEDGELCIGGSGLALGYWNDPVLTKTKFCQVNNSTMFRTGDIVKQTIDGNIVFLRRNSNDKMVKVRGYRVDLGDIESAILEYSTGVIDCRVITQVKQKYNSIIAYVRPRDDTVSTKKIRKHLAKYLPQYMFPSEIHFISEWPRTYSGKIDPDSLISQTESETIDKTINTETQFRTSDSNSRNLNSKSSIASVIKDLIRKLSETLETNEKIDPHMNFFEVGLDSISAMTFQGALEPYYDNVSVTELFQYPSIASLAKYIMDHNLIKRQNDFTPEYISERVSQYSNRDQNLKPNGEYNNNNNQEINSPFHVQSSQYELNSIKPESSNDIAIIGYTARLPGSDDIDTFWENLKAGREGLERRHDSNSKLAPGFGEITDVDKFDAQFFGINNLEAENMDPQLRLFLEGSWTALEDAGYDVASHSSDIALFSSTSVNTYLMMNIMPSKDAYVKNLTSNLGESFNFLIQNEKDFVATRTSYLLNLRGPSMDIQTACSSSLVSTHMACKGIRQGEFDMALVGGVSASFSEISGTPYEEGSIFSPDGHCRPFDADANGTVRSNGLAFIVLKRLDQAIQDRDNIRAVIKGTAVNNDGNTKVSYTAPSVSGQTNVIQQALKDAQVPADTIDFIETHGTATSLGDKIELEAIRNSYLSLSSRDFKCNLGAVKSNIGHTDVVAGLAGLLKTVLSMQNNTIPPTLHFKGESPHLQLEPHFSVPTQAIPWHENKNHPRRAGVSSFGFGGTNAHIILEEAPQRQFLDSDKSHHLLLLTAKTENSLEKLKQNYIKFLKTINQQQSLADICFTSQIGRNHFDHRFFTVNDTPLKMIEDLQQTSASYYNRKQFRECVFMFPGQGSQYIHFGANLYLNENIFRKHLNHFNQYSLSEINFDVIQALNTFNGSSSDHIQIMILAVEISLALTLEEYGINPAAVYGHSLGEISAAVYAQVLTIPDAIKMVDKRTALMNLTEKGQMLSVKGIEANELHSMIPQNVSIAAVNSKNICTLSGSSEQLRELENVLTTQGAQCRFLPMEKAFHSSKMEPILHEYVHFIQANIHLSPPNIPLYSNVSGKQLEPNEAVSPQYWAQQIRFPVLFQHCTENMNIEYDPIFIEVGPGTNLSTFVRTQLPSASTVSMMKHQRDPTHEYQRWLQSIGQLWCYHLPIKISKIYEGEQRLRVRIPTYCFERTRYWFSDRQHRSSFLESTTPSKRKKALAAQRSVKESDLSSASETREQRDIETFVKSAFADILGLEHVESSDNFFSKGGHSLILSSLVSRINQNFNINMRLEDAFSDPTIDGMTRLASKYTDKKINEPKMNSSISNTRLPRPDPIPCSLEQQRIWFLDRLHPKSAANLVVGSVKFKQDFDIHHFETAMNIILEKHESLRTNFVLPHRNGSFPTQKIHDRRTLSLKEETPSSETPSSETPSSDPEQIVNDTLRQECQTPFDLAQDLLFRVRIFILSDGSRLVIFILHHIIADGISLGVLAQELSQLYSAIINGQDVNNTFVASPLRFQYADYAVEQHNLKSNNHEWRQAIKYWKEKLSDLTPFEIAPDYVRPKRQTFNGANISKNLSSELSSRIKSWASQQQSSLFSVLLGLFNAFLSQTTNQTDIVLGTPVSNRSRPETEQLIGLLLNVVTLRTQIEQNNVNIIEAVHQSQQVLREAMTHRFVPFEVVVESLRIDRDLSRSPVFQILFVNEIEAVDASDSHIIETVDSNLPIAQYDLTVSVRNLNNGNLKLMFNYNTDLYQSETMEKLMDRFELFIEAALQNPEIEIAQLKLEKEKRSKKLTEEDLPRDLFEMVVLNCWRHVLGEEDISIHDPFFEIGGTSFNAVQMISNVNEALQINIPLSLIFEAQTIAKLAQKIREDAQFTPQDPLVPIRSTGTQPPLFFVHAAGGFALFFRQLAMLLGPDQPFYAFEDLSLYHSQEPFDSIESMADSYTQRILATQHSGPYRIGGFCFGGVVAFEIARRLKELGNQVEPVILLDSRVRPDSNEDVDVLCLFVNQLETLSGITQLTHKDEIVKEPNQEKLWHYAFQLSIDGGVIPQGFQFEHFMHFAHVLRQHLQIQGEYVKNKLASNVDNNVPLFVLRSHGSFDQEMEEETLEWCKMTNGEIITDSADGSHLTMIYPPFVEKVAEKIEKQIQQ